MGGLKNEWWRRSLCGWL